MTKLYKPVWVRVCTRRVEVIRNVIEQKLQLNGFSPVEQREKGTTSEEEWERKKTVYFRIAQCLWRDSSVCGLVDKGKGMA